MVDPSALVDALVSKDPGGDAARRRIAGLERIHAPGLLQAEVASALRRMESAQVVSGSRARNALRAALDLRIVEYPFQPFAARAWQLRRNLSVYDAWYVAVAEALDAPLVTSDARLGRVDGLRCRVDVVGAPPSPA